MQIWPLAWEESGRHGECESIIHLRCDPVIHLRLSSLPRLLFLIQVGQVLLPKR